MVVIERWAQNQQLANEDLRSQECVLEGSDLMSTGDPREGEACDCRLRTPSEMEMWMIVCSEQARTCPWPVSCGYECICDAILPDCSVSSRIIATRCSLVWFHILIYLPQVASDAQCHTMQPELLGAPALTRCSCPKKLDCRHGSMVKQVHNPCLAPGMSNHCRIGQSWSSPMIRNGNKGSKWETKPELIQS